MKSYEVTRVERLDCLPLLVDLLSDDNMSISPSSHPLTQTTHHLYQKLLGLPTNSIFVK